MAEINLIPQEERANERVEHLQKRLQATSIGLLIFTAILTIVTLSLFAMFASARTKLIAEVDDYSSKINQFKTHEELIVVVKDKASAASQLISSRVEFPDVFDKFSQLIPQGIYFTDIRVATGKIVISGRAKTSADVAGLATSLVSASGSEVVSDVSIDSLSSDDKGIYSFVVSAKLVESNTAQESEAIVPPGSSAEDEEEESP